MLTIITMMIMSMITTTMKTVTDTITKRAQPNTSDLDFWALSFSPVLQGGGEAS